MRIIEKKHSFFGHFFKSFALGIIFFSGILLTHTYIYGAELNQLPKFEQNPGILPISPFYFLKEWRREFIRSFTKDALSHGVFELSTLDEKAAELERVEKFRPDSEKDIIDAIENYQRSQSRLLVAIKNVDENTFETAEKEKFVQEIMKRLSRHDVYFEDFLTRYQENVKIISMMREVQQKMIDIVKASKIVSDEVFEKNVRKYFSEKSVMKILNNTPQEVLFSLERAPVANTTIANPIFLPEDINTTSASSGLEIKQ